MDCNSQILHAGAMLHHGTYRIDRVLGQGGFGITYLATDTSLDRKVAIKEFFPKDYCDRNGATSHVTLGTQNTAEFVNRLKAKFLKEARNIARLEYPGIIHIHAAFEENNTAYYVMEYIEGATLSEMVKRSGPMAPDKALGYIEKVGDALEYIHANRINHLDVKPANIMVRASDNEPVLIDFGLSKQYDREGHQTSTTPTGISHGYAPLEQYKAGGLKDFSPQTDLYSLAATLYFILTGTVPPQATDLADEDLTFPREIPAHVAGAISKAMSSGRKQRHESVREFLNDLRSGGDPDEATVIVSEETVVPPLPATSAKAETPPAVARHTVEPPKEQIVSPQTPEPPAAKKAGRGKILILVAIAVAVIVIAGVTSFLLLREPDKPSSRHDEDTSLFAENTQEELTPEELFDKGVDAYNNKDYTTASEWWIKAAEQGDKEAQNNLGFLYYNGYGVRKDYAEAANYWRQSAEQGNAEAQFNLASAYENGEGVPSDTSEALQWYRKSADQGYAAAQYALGCIYYNGDYVTKNLSEAAKWWKLTADQGDKEAIKELKALQNVGVTP